MFYIMESMSFFVYEFLGLSKTKIELFEECFGLINLMFCLFEGKEVKEGGCFAL